MLYPKDSTYEERCEIVKYINSLVGGRYIVSDVKSRVSRKRNDKDIERKKEVGNLQTRDRILWALINKDDSGFQEDIELLEIYSICKKKLKEKSIDVGTREAEELVLTEIENFIPPWQLQDPSYFS